MPITVEVRLWGRLRRVHPGDDPSASREVQLPQGATARKLLTQLNLTPDEHGALIISLGEQLIDLDHTLQEGDRLNVAPPGAGG